jgi:hypothetical protein
MRNGLLALIGVLTAAGAATAQQPAPDAPPATVPVQVPAEPRFGRPWDRSWERVLLSAAPQPAPQPPPEQPAEPESPANRFWFSADYLLWWTKNGPLAPPLLTTGPANADIVGGLTQPGTRILFGGAPQDYDTSNGLRLDVGFWLDDNRRWGLEGCLFLLEQRATGFTSHSNAAGTPVLAQPLIDPTTGQEFTEIVALPGLITGGVAIVSHSRLQGWDIDGLANAFRTDHFSLDVLAGVRAVKLDEDLQVATDFAPLTSDFLTFRGATVNAPSSLATIDSFQAQNKFYGFELGGRFEWTAGALTVGALGKVALGGTQELVRILGESALLTPGAPTVTAPGGVLAVGPTVGRRFQDEFAVLPEVGVELRYRLSRHVEVHFGYTFLYWSSVVRPGSLVSRAVAAGLVPTDPNFGTATGTPAAFQFHSSDYWAQGLNFGLELHF